MSDRLNGCSVAKALHMHINLLHSVATERGPWLRQLWENLAVCIEAFNPANSESSDRTWDRKWHSSIVHGNRGSLWHNNDKRSRNSRMGFTQEMMYCTTVETGLPKGVSKISQQVTWSKTMSLVTYSPCMFVQFLVTCTFWFWGFHMLE